MANAIEKVNTIARSNIEEVNTITDANLEDLNTLVFGEDPGVGSGGTTTSITGYSVHTFSSSGTFTVSTAGEFEIVMVAGGGGGGECRAFRTACSGGGGGSGGVLHGSPVLTTGDYAIVIGAGGNGGTDEHYTSSPPGGTAAAPTDGSNTTMIEGTWGTATAIGGAHGSESVWWEGSATADKGAGGGGGIEGIGQGSNEDGLKSDGTQGDSNGLTGLGGDGVDGNHVTFVGSRGGGGGGADGNASGVTGGTGYTSSINGSSYEYGGGGDVYAHFSGSSPGSKCGAGQATRRYGEGGEGSRANKYNYNTGNSPPDTAYSGRCKAGNGGAGVVVIRFRT